MDGTIFDEEMPQGEEFNHDSRDVYEETKDREQVQSDKQVEKEERQVEHQNEEECSKTIEQNSNKNSVNDSGRKTKGQSNRIVIKLLSLWHLFIKYSSIHSMWTIY
jgi:hypothetical protein